MGCAVMLPPIWERKQLAGCYSRVRKQLPCTRLLLQIGRNQDRKGPHAATSMQPFCSCGQEEEGWCQMQRSCVRAPFSTSSSVLVASMQLHVPVLLVPGLIQPAACAVVQKELEAFPYPTPPAGCVVACGCSCL
jgi:hypothetical protein